MASWREGSKLQRCYWTAVSPSQDCMHGILYKKTKPQTWHSTTVQDLLLCTRVNGVQDVAFKTLSTIAARIIKHPCFSHQLGCRWQRQSLRWMWLILRQLEWRVPGENHQLLSRFWPRLQRNARWRGRRSGRIWRGWFHDSFIASYHFSVFYTFLIHFDPFWSILHFCSGWSVAQAVNWSAFR